MPANESGSANQHSDCESRFLSLVKDLDRVLASDPETIGPVFEVFYKNFPVEKCAVEEVLSIARSSRFFTSSEETPAYYNIAFNSSRVSSRPGFAVLMSLSKQTGNLELPFAKVNGY